MAKSSFLKNLGNPFGILAILFIISIVLYYSYNNYYKVEGLTPGKKATVEEETVEGYRRGGGRDRRTGRSTTLGANGQRYNTGY